MNLNHKEIWAKCLVEIKKNVDERSFNTWFKPIKPVILSGKTLTIQVPNKFFYEWLEEKYINLLGSVLFKYLGKDAGLQYQIVVDDHKDIVGNYEKSLDKKYKDKNYFNIFDAEFNYQLNPNYTFENFIEGPCNQLARNAALSITKNPGKTAFNPLIIYGGVGLGKTHLVNALGNKIKSHNPGAKIIYTNTERFTNQIIKALRDNVIYDLVNSFQLVDTFIIDDIQFLEGRTKTQEIFFNIFNFLHQRDKQLVITSDKSPKDLKGIQERLISRFKWGLVTDLKKPNLETRVKIIESKAQRNQLQLPDDVINYIGYNVKGSIRDLEGVLVSLSANMMLNDKKIDLKLTSEVIDNFSHNVDKEINIENIQKIISDFFNIPIEQITGKSRKRNIVIARQLGIYFSKQMTSYSLKQIGSQFGNRDHATVLHSIKTVNNLMDTDTLFAETVAKLEHKLENSLIKPVY
ncbi:MAG TPA: chromosomal replication initiator protein DnaA [Bacteroidetes bacterium]|nr:chromosomal replication initiator protein DnaA [Bacteroidota bacterium]